MEQHQKISQLQVGDSLEGFYVLKSAFSKVSSNGKPFLNAVLSDQTGDIDAKVWDYSGPVGGGDEGTVVLVRGTVTEFRGAAQVTVDAIRLAEEGDRYEASDLVPVAPIDPQLMFEEVRGLLESIGDPDYRAAALELLHRHEAAFRSLAQSFSGLSANISRT